MPFSIDETLAGQEARGAPGRGRHGRSDRGQSRLPGPVQRRLSVLFGTQERPAMRVVMGELRAFCARRRLPVPARATVYNTLSRLDPPSYAFDELPEAVRRTLHNVDPRARVPGPDIVQRSFQVGSVAAVSFASSLPWLCLYQAAGRRGWRPKSRAMLEAVMRFRGIRR